MKTAQDYINGEGAILAGFNRRIQGFSYNEAFKYPNERRNRELLSGWELAEYMIDKGKAYYVHNFHESHQGCKNGHAFIYGGTWACNTCNTDGFQKDWWVIKTYKDGDAWCCVGEDFTNLQESECYAFGDTREDAIKNYGDLYAGSE